MSDRRKQMDRGDKSLRAPVSDREAHEISKFESKDDRGGADVVEDLNQFEKSEGTSGEDHSGTYQCFVEQHHGTKKRENENSDNSKSFTVSETALKEHGVHGSRDHDTAFETGEQPMKARPIPGYDARQNNQVPGRPADTLVEGFQISKIWIAIFVGFVAIGAAVIALQQRQIDELRETVAHNNYLVASYAESNATCHRRIKELEKLIRAKIRIKDKKIKGLLELSETHARSIKELEKLIKKDQQQIKELLGLTIMAHEVFQFRDVSDCSDVSPTDATTWNGTGGIFNIYHQQNVIPVYCDMKTDGGGWLVIQRRMDGSVDFYRKWNEYKEGFGKMTGEFWLGLQKIHELTASNQYELRIDMGDWDGLSSYASYTTFRVGDEKSKFQLTIGGFSGDAGDSLYLHDQKRFSTHDHESDTSEGNCAEAFKGAWWFGNCYQSHLNGYYHVGGDTSRKETPFGASSPGGVKWKTWREKFYSLKFSEMKIRKRGAT